jgi:hypothetical protein
MINFDTSIIEKTKKSREFVEQDLADLVNKIRFRIKPISLGGCFLVLSSTHRAFAAAALVCDNDLSQFKQHMHVAALCTTARWAVNDGDAHSYCRHFYDAVLSDSPKAIKALTDIRPTNLNEYPNSPHMWSYLWLNALLGNDDAIRAELPRIEKKGYQKDRKDVREGRDFWSLLLARDKEALERRILYDVKAPSEDATFDDFMSLQAAAQAKLCHIRGILVDIDHLRVPMDLVRIAPLPHYDDVYDFLAPGYEPPPQGLFGHVKSWFKCKRPANPC